jgi:hypothetical protein
MRLSRLRPEVRSQRSEVSNVSPAKAGVHPKHVYAPTEAGLNRTSPVPSPGLTSLLPLSSVTRWRGGIAVGVGPF